MRICVETFSTNINNKLAQIFPAKFCLRKQKFVDLLQSVKPEKETFPNPYYLYVPIASTIAEMVVSMFDWILLGSSVIGFFLEYSEIGFSLGSSVIGSSLVYSVKGFFLRVLFKVLSDRVLFKVILSVLSEASHLVSSVLVFWYPVCHQLHQQLQGFTAIFCFKHFKR